MGFKTRRGGGIGGLQVPMLVLAWWPGGLAWAEPAVLDGASSPATLPQPERPRQPVADPGDYLVGASLVSSRGHLGQGRQRLSLQPLWAFQLGRWRFATSRASDLLSVGRDPVDPGVSTELVTAGGWRLSTSLRHDAGRRADAADPLLAGLPPVRATLRGRIGVSRALGERWTSSLQADQDLLGRGGGLNLGLGLQYRHPLSRQTHWDAFVAAGWGQARYLRTRYGVSPASALATGRVAYQPGSGWESLGAGVQLTSALGPHWVAFGGLSVSQLQGAAARSPLVGQRTVYGVSLGLAWRSSRAR